MNNNIELQELIEVFKGYRDLITPLQENMKSLALAFESLKEDVSKLNSAFDGGLGARLEDVAETLEKQSVKSAQMATAIDKFSNDSARYFKGVSLTLDALDKAEKKLESVSELENQAKEQIKKLDSIIEDKKVNYNIKDLQKSLEIYNVNVKKMSDFINKDVADSLSQNAKEIEQIKRENETVSAKLDKEKQTLDEMLSVFRSSNEMLKNAVEKQDVNEAYIFDVLDKWAVSRKVKIKK